MTTMREERVRELIRGIYQFPTCIFGGPLHYAIEDNHLADSDLDFCEQKLLDHASVQYAQPADQDAIRELGHQIIDQLRAMPEPEREETVRGVW